MGKELTRTDIELQVQEERYRRRVEELEAELAVARKGAENLEESMRFIGQHPCFWQGFPSKTPCAEKLADVSEWCWPCYAKAIVEDRGGMARAFAQLEAGGPGIDEATRLMVLAYRDALQRLPSDREVDALCWAWQHGITEGKPIPITLWCPNGHRHIDKGAFAAKPHHTHSCQICGITWRPAVVDTVGVQYLPGFKDDEPKPPAKPLRRRTPAQRRERRLATLRRRYEWLAGKESPSDFDKAEVSALRWALEQLEARVLSYEIVIDVAHTEAFMVELEKRLRGLASDVEGPVGA